MKKTLLILLALILSFSMISCSNFKDVIEFKGENGETYFYEYSDGIKSITNYHPHKFWALPDYQELVQYGDGAGVENEGKVYFIYVVDTSLDPESTKAYYSAEFDGETKELFCEEGEYFSDEAQKNALVERLLSEIDTAYFK